MTIVDLQTIEVFDMIEDFEAFADPMTISEMTASFLRMS